MPAGPAPTMARRSLVNGGSSLCAWDGASARSLDDRLRETRERLLDGPVGERLESLHRPVGPAVRLGECICGHLMAAQLRDGGAEVGVDGVVGRLLDGALEPLEESCGRGIV